MYNNYNGNCIILIMNKKHFSKLLMKHILDHEVNKRDFYFFF